MLSNEAWIKATSRAFAKRLVQEAAMTDFQGPNMSQSWLDEMGAKLDELIASECDIADEQVAVILIQGPVTHTDDSPLCWDPECPCKQDIDLLKEQVFEPFFDGLLTAPEAHRFMEGKQV